MSFSHCHAAFKATTLMKLATETNAGNEISVSYSLNLKPREPYSSGVIFVVCYVLVLCIHKQQFYLIT